MTFEEAISQNVDLRRKVSKLQRRIIRLEDALHAVRDIAVSEDEERERCGHDAKEDPMRMVLTQIYRRANKSL